jgi:hypothetical protein
MVFGKYDLADLPLLLLLSVSASALFLAAMIMLQSLAFLTNSRHKHFGRSRL